MASLNELYRYLEPALTVGSGALAEPFAGWAGILGGGAEGVERTRAAMTYQPRTEQGRAGLNALANALQSAKKVMVDENPPVNALVQGFNTAADWAGEQSPALGAAVRTAPAALGLLAGPGSAATRGAFANVGRDTVSGLNRIAQVLGENSAAPVMRGPLTHQVGAIPMDKQKRLAELIQKWDQGDTSNPLIKDFVEATPEQQSEIQSILQEYWGNPNYTVPSNLPAKMGHLYKSRAIKDQFNSSELLPWVVKAGEDSAKVTVDGSGRPAFTGTFIDAGRGVTYPVRMPIRSDALGNVYVDDVIPKGLDAPSKKKTP